MRNRMGWLGLLLGSQFLIAVEIQAQSADPAATTSPAPTGMHVAMIATSKLQGAKLKAGKDGIVLVWLLEPGGLAFPPGFGGIRLSFDGTQYNRITSPTSSDPLAPDLVVHDAARFAQQHSEVFAKRGPPASGSMVLEFYVRGDKPLPTTAGKVAIELGIWPPGLDAGSGTPRWIWYEFPFKP